ncbi:PLP-dependent transferase [Coccomyxa subellipsoidea C-169]|uniref:PLP-dependent transferase n=1 Tax=Coccomyxa subellipsoidea (strain C-169) TaxID=574566 RepID=I0YMZ8_COCSC|nr:PLP-dependent transferase [Coccomyxa subellipsoidea C-169]EIE19767.1 PLP-dependent transferase [Coccomyxa subellipsoidea C-169]|eukprot:XP_005644311.1 PLP-dependent transferase [Coccomyxa subellipsoidea C-169]
MAGLRKLVTAFAGVPGIIGLHGGLPPASAFPITELTYTLKDGQKIVVDDPAKLAAAQQYSLVTSGYPPLHRWAKSHMLSMHSPPAGVHDLIMTNGNNQTIEMVMRLLMDKGDAILCEEYTYPHVAESFVQPQGYTAVPLSMDSFGIVPSLLRQTMESFRAAGKPLPRLLYTVPVGQNPTGVVTPFERRKEIYALCREYDIVLLEDDPYYYLQFSPGGGQPKGLCDLGRSYLSMDVDGRVVRMDSFSKVLAPGMRLGWVTAAPKLIEKIIYHLQGVHIGANSFIQVVVAEMLDAWGEAGFEAHVRAMQTEYAQRAAVVQAAAERHLAGLAEWQPPAAGMFLWLRLLGIPDARSILDALKDSGVVLVPGRFCHCCGPEHHKACPYLRVSFASATLADLSEGMARLGAVLRRFTSPPDSTAASSSAASDGVPASVFTSASSGAAHAGRAAAGGIRALDSAFELKGGAEGPAGRKAEGRSPTLCLSREGPGEVVPDCRAKVELVSGSAAVSEDALAPLPAKTIAGIPATHLGA